MVIANACRDLTLVEGRMSGSQACSAPLRRCRPLGIDHVLQRASKVGLAKDLARAWRGAARKKDLRITGKAPVLGFIAGEGVAKARVGGKAVTGQADSGLGNVSETHAAVALERRDPARR